MKNTDCIIYIITKRGCKQIYFKKSNSWKQKSSKGIVRKITAEQLLSHILPLLVAGNKSHLTIKVKKRVKKTKKK